MTTTARTTPPPRRHLTPDEIDSAYKAAEAALNRAHEILAELHWHTLEPLNAELAGAVWDVIDGIEDAR